MQDNTNMINVAYNTILILRSDGSYLYPASNVLDYDVHPFHTVDKSVMDEFKVKYGITYPHKLQPIEPDHFMDDINRLNSQDFRFLVDRAFKIRFKMCTVDEVYESGEDFIYPIILYNFDIFVKYDTIDLPEKVVKSVLNNKCKICFIQPTEGFFGHRPTDIPWLYKLSKKYGFSKGGMIMITANLKAQESKEDLLREGVIEDNFTIHPYNYFQHDLWFLKCMVFDQYCVNEARNLFNECLEENRNQKKELHFLSFNRITKAHRVVIFGELMCNDLLKNKSILTMAATELDNKHHFYNIVCNNIDEDYGHSKEKLKKFLYNYDATKHYIYDCEDLRNNKADNLNIDAHKKTFVNIVTESLVNPEVIFFSEKTFKPMTCAQPFIMVGNPHSLKKLKELGFMTFDKWWDESYDDETDFTRRMDKIITLLEEIASWDMEKCYRITQEMTGVLINNFNVMVDSKEAMNLIKLLETGQNKLI